ncbi:MAG: prepilin-type N-terminal cleavage/methylation domain-containing protein [bacterium]|nr:prepilin-type N-terminal cleavage/methylation domain-containing protein [bacterium]
MRNKRFADGFVKGIAISPNRKVPRRTRDRRAFTLVELLVVVSIIALLISILLPSLRTARAQARMVKCLAHIRGMGQAAVTFAGSHNGRFQLVGHEDAIQKADPDHVRFAYDENGEILSWPVALAQASSYRGYDTNFAWGVRANDWSEAESRKKLMKEDFGLARCPSDQAQISTTFYPSGNSLGPLPADQPAGDRYFGYLSYGINEDIVGANDKAAVDGNGNPLPACWKNGCQGQVGNPNCWPGDRLEGNLDRVFSPGDCLLMVDSGPNSKEEGYDTVYGDYVLDGYFNLIISAKAPGPYLGDTRGTWPLRVPDKRHPKKRLNVLFADLHAAGVVPVAGEDWILGGGNVPKKYAPRVRVSPYKPWRED